jgi:uncharacterized protein YjcR
LSDITIDFLKEITKTKTDKELSEKLGIKVNTIRTWKARGIPAKEKIKFL